MEIWQSLVSALAGDLHEVRGVQAHTKVRKFLHDEKKYGERIKVCVNGTWLLAISYRLLVADTGIGSAVNRLL
jgi:hypothetical protein